MEAGNLVEPIAYEKRERREYEEIEELGVSGMLRSS
jgi:hypothetical protein